LQTLSATAQASPNIAFIKYWGDRGSRLHIPASGSISMNLAGLFSRVSVSFDPALTGDTLELNGSSASVQALERTSNFLDYIRRLAGISLHAQVISENNFPMGAGIASSASAFAALALAASRAAGLDLAESQLSRLARLGSGSACRSVPAGFVEWRSEPTDAGSYAVSIAPPEHWDLADCVAVINTAEKSVGSRQGHALAETSPLQAARLAGAPQRLEICRRAILSRDFDALAKVVELDSTLMHAVMMTSDPPLFYWQSTSLEIIKAVPTWRRQGMPVCCTLDAGPNVHVICASDALPAIKARIEQFPGVQKTYIAHPGGAAHFE
jgi:diphosphomevalonate decarboxylase